MWNCIKDIRIFKMNTLFIYSKPISISPLSTLPYIYIFFFFEFILSRSAIVAGLYRFYLTNFETIFRVIKMNEYQYLTSKIQVPKEWPVEAGRNMFIYVVQDAISHHELGQRTVLTIEKVSALVTSNKNTPGYLLEKIEKM